MTEDRPLDVLGSAKGKRVIVVTKNTCDISGTLKAFDSHLNLWLDDAMIEPNIDDDTEKPEDRELGTILLRGDSIVMISPVK